MNEKLKQYKNLGDNLKLLKLCYSSVLLASSYNIFQTVLLNLFNYTVLEF